MGEEVNKGMCYVVGLFFQLYGGLDNWVLIVVFYLLFRIDKETEERRQKAIEEVIKLSVLSTIDLV